MHQFGSEDYPTQLGYHPVRGGLGQPHWQRDGEHHAGTYGPAPAPPPSGYPPCPSRRPTNSLAIAALVCSLLLAPLGIVLGHVSLSQIKRSGEEGRGFAIAGLAIGYLFTVTAVVGLIAFVVFVAALGSAVRHSVNAGLYPSTPSYTYATPTSPTETAVGVPDASARTIYNAQVGDCIKRVSGSKRSDGTYSVTVSRATCGSSSATDKVTMRTHSTAGCTSGEWVETVAYTPPVVLCLSKLR